MFMIIFWAAVFISAAVIEAVSFALISVWFAIGAAAGLISAGLGAPVWLQFTVFTAVSALTLIFTRPVLKKLFPNKFIPTNSELSVGKTAVVIEDIDPGHGKGRVRLGGVDWLAVTDGETLIPKDEVVTVTAVRGAKLAVKKAEE